MTGFDDLPTLQPFPDGNPSDAELEAERDAKHAAAVAAWERGAAVSQPGGDALDTSKVVLPQPMPVRANQ